MSTQGAIRLTAPRTLKGTSAYAPERSFEALVPGMCRSKEPLRSGRTTRGAEARRNLLREKIGREHLNPVPAASTIRLAFISPPASRDERGGGARHAPQ
jgi:hypothetical protein